MKPQIPGCSLQDTSKSTPRSAGIVACPPLRCSSGDSAAIPGCEPFDGWGSCIGSPNKTTFFADVATAIASASESCPASSIMSKSTVSRMSSCAKAQVVPATTPNEATLSANPLDENVTASSWGSSGASPFLRMPIGEEASVMASTTSRRRFSIAL